MQSAHSEVATPISPSPSTASSSFATKYRPKYGTPKRWSPLSTQFSTHTVSLAEGVGVVRSTMSPGKIDLRDCGPPQLTRSQELRFGPSVQFS